MKTTIKNKLKEVFLAVFTILAFACSGDDNDNTPDLEEVWRVSEIFTTNSFDLNSDGIATQALLQEANCTFDQTITFISDASGIFESESLLLIKEGITTDTYEGICSTVDPIIADITWSKTETSRTFVLDGVSYTGTLEGNQLVFTLIDALPIYNNEGDSIVRYEDIVIIYTLQ